MTAEQKENVLVLIKKYGDHREKRKSRYFEQKLFKQIENAIKTDHEQFYEFLEDA